MTTKTQNLTVEKKMHWEVVGQKEGPANWRIHGTSVRWLVVDANGFGTCHTKTKKEAQQIADWGNTDWDGRGDVGMAYNMRAAR